MDWPVCIIVCRFTFSYPSKLTSNVDWPFMHERIKLWISPSLAKLTCLIFAETGFFSLDRSFANVSLSKVDIREGKPATLYCLAEPFLLLITKPHLMGTLSWLKTGVRTWLPIRSNAEVRGVKLIKRSNIDIRGTSFDSSSSSITSMLMCWVLTFSSFPLLKILIGTIGVKPRPAFAKVDFVTMLLQLSLGFSKLMFPFTHDA